MKAHSKGSTNPKAVTTDQFALHASGPADTEGVTGMARELHGEPRSPPYNGTREEYVWNPGDALKYFFMFLFQIRSV